MGAFLRAAAPSRRSSLNPVVIPSPCPIELLDQFTSVLRPASLGSYKMTVGRHTLPKILILSISIWPLLFSWVFFFLINEPKWDFRRIYKSDKGFKTISFSSLSERFHDRFSDANFADFIERKCMLLRAKYVKSQLIFGLLHNDQYWYSASA